MEKIISKVVILGMALTITLALPTSVCAQEYKGNDVRSKTSSNQIISSTELITPYADIIGWRYKSVDGKMYQRQYNYSKQTWIGEWELCK